MLVLKFGGTSVGSADALGNSIGIVKNDEHRGNVSVIVVSALSGVTDSLIDLAQKSGTTQCAALLETLKNRHRALAGAFLADDELAETIALIEKMAADLLRVLNGVAALGELSRRTLDMVMSFGERLSASILSRVLIANGINAAYLDSRPLVITDDSFGNASVRKEETYAAIRGALAAQPEKVFVATGFIGSTLDGRTTTLGRGGSDLSAAIFGAALDAEAVEIWTDVDGILTADPKLVTSAFRIKAISYVEAMELSHFGAKVLYPPTVRPALEKNIPIRIRNTFEPTSHGTWIRNDAEAIDTYPIRGITSIKNVALVRVQGAGMVGVAGFSSRLFGALARKKINVMLITQGSSEFSICFAVLPEESSGAEAAISEEFEREMGIGVIDPVETSTDLAIIAVVGAQMKKSFGSSGKVFHALGRNGINVVAIAQGSSELNISAVIKRQDEVKALNAIHEAFFLSGTRSVNLFLIGTGLIGGTLLEQIAAHREILADEHQIRVNVVGVADSKHMVFSPSSEGLDPKTLLTLLKGNPTASPAVSPFNLAAFIERMKSMNLPNSAFCDCTASDVVAGQYDAILQAAIPIVTPNKRANSGSFDYYKKIIGYSRTRGIPYLYETTVCAGLPVISTLRDLFLSGDKVRRIEAVLSGTLSYIFNNFDGTKTFSALVREAKVKGYTEPDPRDDLNAMDAARKALVLARECGLSLEFPAVSIEPILPAACFEAATVDAFFIELEKADAGFELRRRHAVASASALRYVAVIEDGAAKIALRSEGEDSPFYSLGGADNIVVITSDRYSSRPIVIKGPGAGAHVTAGGIFADIVRIARTLV
jgi:aspartokinase/homoserine dehydrogenase 1